MMVLVKEEGKTWELLPHVATSCLNRRRTFGFSCDRHKKTITDFANESRPSDMAVNVGTRDRTP